MTSAAEPALFFALGAPKSGTTWIERALNAHPQVVCKSEGKLHFFRDRLAEAGKAYNGFLAERNTKVFGEPTFPPLNIQEVDAVFAAFVETRLRRGGPFPGALRLGSKDPDFGLYMEEYAALFPDADYLHIIRDPRDVCVSMRRHMERVHPEVNIGPMEAFLKDTAIGWVEYLARVRTAVNRYDLSYLEFTYEAMVADPHAVLTRAFDFLKVETSTETVAACVEATRFEVLSRGRAPGQEDRNAFFRKGVAGGWRADLTEAQARIVMDVAGQAAADLGDR